MKTYTPNYLIYVSPLVGLFSLLILLPSFLFLTYIFNNWIYISLTLIIFLFLFFILNYLNVNVKKIILNDGSLTFISNSFNVNRFTIKIEELQDIKLTLIYVPQFLLETKPQNLSSTKKQWSSIPIRGHNFGQIRTYITINTNEISKEYLLSGYSKQTINRLIANFKDEFNHKFEFENYVIKQGLDDIYKKHWQKVWPF